MRDVAKDLGLNPPAATCQDPDCPFHGTVSVRGRILKGEVIKDRMQKNVVVRMEYIHLIPKFKRYERRRGNISAHNPPCISAKSGDRVLIGETRALSKTVSFVVLGKVT